ncbi:uncharacterized protein LOC133835719 isoform X1 [Drosophila sulfurigaster albostrigata]|uniref:uncharacterized protein LOC133835719 isoform X1 n=1 Tax=Drosophila sulfurigaster albostrigata TaxID=89887 RepID=UPI002D21B61D|nr:uncharacterized protein LOC133835719 isoform X1 [Drosophila sulfurigaster albostrigata]
MRIFGKMTRFLQISRCLRYHAPICRPHRLLHGSCKQWKKICSNCASWQPPLLMEIRPHLPMRIHVQLFTTRTTNVFTFNNASDMLRKRICFTGTQNEEAASQIVPVGVIVPDKAESNMKIVIVPLDLVNQDSESLKNTLTVINELRKHANEIDLFTNTIIEDYRKDQLNNQTSDNNNNSNIVEEKAPVMEELEQIAKADDIHLWDTYTTKEVDVVASSAPEISAPELELQAAVASLATDLAASTQADVAPMTPSPFTPSLPNAPPTLPINPNTVPITTPQTQPGAMPLADPIETQISAQPQNEDVPPVAEIEQITIDVPQQLGEHLADMAIASMQLSFEMNMTNVRDAILYGDELIMKDGPKLDSEPMVFLETNVKVDPANEPQFTVPLHFNALIKGTVDIDADRLNPEQLTQENLPNYNDAVTSIAANICSTALQQGFASELTSKPTAQANHDSHKSHAQARMALKRHQAQKHMKMDHKRPKVEYNSPKAALPNTLPQESLAAAVPMPLSPSLKDGCKHPIIKKKKKCPKPCKLPDPCKEDKCNRPQKHQKSKSEDKVEITASAGKKGGKDPCAKGSGSKGKDAKSGKDGKGGKDGKKDPCAKFKKGKDGKSGKDGKKDPCAKGGKDAKSGKKGEKGKDGKDKKDPCAKFKKAKSGKDAKGGKDGKDKKDPCAKLKKTKGGKDAKSGKDGKDGKDKKDPCAKFKKGKGGKDAKSKKGGKDGKDKKDPCAKFKKGKDGKDAKSKKGGKGGKDGKDKKDPCAKFKKGKDGKDAKSKKGGKDGKDKKDPCAKFKKGKDGKDAKSKKGGKDGKDKKDPCAKFKKGKGGKDAKSKKGGKDGKDKKDPCAKFKKGKGGKDAKSKKGGKDGKDKKDPCAKFKKGKGGKDAKSKKDPCKKKFSTCTSPLSQLNQSKSLWHPKRRLSTSRRAQSLKPAHFTVYSTLVRRHYAGLQMSAWLPRTQFNRTYGKKDEGQKSKCAALQSKQPKRKHKKARTGLRTDCYGQHSDECPKKFVAKCSTVKFPKKKCEKPKSKPPMAKMQKPKKKLPNVCKHANPRQERNKLLKSGLCSLNQMRMQSYSLLSIKRFVSQAATENCMPQEEEASSGSVEVVKIPVSYHIRKEHKERPNLKKYDVLIRTASIALTGSDIHVYENANRDIEGITLGHDATGFVEEIGSCVQNLHVGDRVVMEAALSCGICDYCKNGQYNICTDLVYNGFMASHQSHPADLCHRLPNSISMEEGTLTQTLAMGCQACFKANITPTSNVLIIGSTPTGVSTAMCAAAIGAKRVIVAGTMASALQTINRVFGFATIHFEPNALFGEVLETIYKNFDGWPNCAINCAVAPMTMNLAVMALQPCGVCVLSECECECASFNALDVLMKNIRIIPSFRSANMYPTALTLMKSGRAPMHKFIAKTFTWSELDEAFKSALHESNIGPRKIIVNSTEGINIGDLLKKKLNSNVADNKVACDK